MRRVAPPSGGTARPRPPTGGSAPARPPARATTGSRPAVGGDTAPKLLFTGGPREGEQIALSGEEVVIGRSNDVTIPVADTSVSRRHLSLRRVGQGWVAKDLGSGNGTLVNGELIAEETPIHHGDTVVLGETEFTFSDDANVTGRVSVPVARPRTSGEVPARRPTGSRPTISRTTRAAEDPGAARKRKLLVGGLALVVLIVFGGVAAVKLGKRQQELLDQQARAEQAAALASLEGKMQEARNLVRQAKWKEAKALLSEVSAASPTFQNVGDLIARADVEIPNQERLATADEALKQGQIARAEAAFKEISADTAMFEQVGQLRRTISEKARSRLFEANDRVREGKFKEALAIAEDVLAAYPEDRDAQLLVEQSKEGIEKGKVTPRVFTPEPKGRITDPAVAKFIDGDLTGAAAILNTCSDQRACKDMLGAMTEFGSLYKKLDNLDEKGLSQLLALDRKITGGSQSKLARTAGTKAAGIYLRAAQSYKASGRWDKVRQYLSRALQANPGLAEAKKLETELKDRAQALYMSGYSLKDNDPDSAIEKFRDVIQMTDSDDEYHGKAKNWLAKLGR